MKFDENLVSQNLEDIKIIFNKMITVMESIKSANDSISNYENWDSPVCEAYRTQLQNMNDNFLRIENQFTNIRQFVDTVIGNYTEADRSHGKLYNNMVVK